jgi:hypothetical protein
VALFAEEKTTGFGFGKLIDALPIGSLAGNGGIVIAGLFSGCFVGFIDGGESVFC